jgi:hypothetical protein
MQELYLRSRTPLRDIVIAMRPDLDQSSAEALAMYLSASMEAALLFVGYGKPHQHMKSSLEAITQWNYVMLIRTIGAEKIANLEAVILPAPKTVAV